MKTKGDTCSRTKVFIIIAVLTVILGFTALANAVIVTYQFSGTITSVYQSASGFPSILQGIQAGDTFTGTYSYDSATLSSATPYPNDVPYNSATHYEIPNTLSLTIGNVSIPLFGSILDIFVWNDANLYSELGITYPHEDKNDGYYVSQRRNGSNPYFIDLGNWLLPSGTFSDGSLPTTSIAPANLLLYGQYGYLGYSPLYLDGNIETMTVTANSVPIPPAIWMFGPSLLGLIGIRKKFRK